MLQLLFIAVIISLQTIFSLVNSIVVNIEKLVGALITKDDSICLLISKNKIALTVTSETH